MQSRTTIDNGTIHTLCRQCAHHCGVYAHIENGRITKISGNKTHPENQGMVCPKGREAPEWVYHPDRLTGCLKRTASGDFTPISYDRALDEISEKIINIRDKFGARAMSAWTGEAIGFLQQEAYAHRFINALGSPNFFTADSVCFASRLMAYVTCQGYWSYPPDFEHARMTILWGTNPAYSHPPFMQAINRSRRQAGKLVVVDPRRSVAAGKADLFLQIRPGTDAALALGLIRFLIEQQAYDKAFVKDFSTGFEALAAYAEKFTPEYVARQTGVSEALVDRMQQMMRDSLPRCVSFPGISIEHQTNGFNTVRAIASLSALCGAIDIEGGDPWSKDIRVNSLCILNGQQFSEMNPAGYNSYPLFYDVMGKCHSLPGIDYMLGKGKYPIKGLIFSGTNPVLTNPNTEKVVRAFSTLDLLVARDLFLTQSAKLAHYIIPAASFLERSELHFYPHIQRVALSRKVLEVEDVWDEYTFWHDLAHRLGFGETYFVWEDEAAINEWILEPTGISLEDLAAKPDGVLYDVEFEHRKYKTHPFPTPSGRFEFASGRVEQLGHDPLPVYIPPDFLTSPSSDYPLRMISGSRSAIYYHSRYREIGKFKKKIPAAQAEIHEEDAAELAITDGERVRIVSEIGELVIQIKVMDNGSILKGFIDVPHGWNIPNVNRLTNDKDVDPIGGFPNLKIVPVRVEKLV
jgi:anaerobic selenocysteine-containing dehydrogenase